MFALFFTTLLTLSGFEGIGNECRNCNGYEARSAIPVFYEVQRYQKEVDFEELYGYVARQMRASIDTLQFFPLLYVYSNEILNEDLFFSSLHLHCRNPISTNKTIFRLSELTEVYFRFGVANFFKYKKIRTKFDCVSRVFVYSQAGEYLTTFSVDDNCFIHPSWGMGISNLNEFPDVSFVLSYNNTLNFYFILQKNKQIDIIDIDSNQAFKKTSWKDICPILEISERTSPNRPLSNTKRKWSEDI